MLRPYQQKAIDDLFSWFRENKSGNPCLSVPTGGGKSHIVAELCKLAASSRKDIGILMLTHQKELIEQNAEKLKAHWPDAPIGIFSAGLGSREVKQVTFAGIQSVHSKASELGPRRLVIIDECHLVNHKDSGMYRNLLSDLLELDPDMRVVGLTATPFRLGHGYIHEGDGLFDALIEPVTIRELIDQGFLTRLQSKLTEHNISTDGVHKRGGEFIESELQSVVNTDQNNFGAVKEIIRHGSDRKSWLCFCTGVEHAYNIRNLIREYGITCETVTGETPSHERAQILKDFKAGKIQCLTNANVLTTGFDHPGIDLVALLRPTMSPSLYLQMVGRGLRITEGKENCKVLDFVGAVSQHGPITNVQPPAKKGEKVGEAPVKICPECQEIVHLSAMVCPVCAYEWPKEEHKKVLHVDDIMGEHPTEMFVMAWRWKVHTSKRTGSKMLKVTYCGTGALDEYFAIKNEGYAGKKSKITLYDICQKSGISHENMTGDLDLMAARLNKASSPRLVTYKRKGKFPDIKERVWKSLTA